MKEFPLEYPPSGAGVYQIRNIHTNQRYIGYSIDLLRRYAEWRSAAKGSLGNGGSGVNAILANTKPEDWAFGVLRSMPGATVQDLLAAEYAEILAAKAQYGELVINKQLMPPISAIQQIERGKQENIKGVANTAGTTLTYQGNTVTYSDACALIGCTRDTLTKRLAKYRQKGVYTLTVEFLLARGVGNPDTSVTGA
jgi:hypothetical protein